MTDIDKNLLALCEVLYESGFMDMVTDKKEFFIELTKNLKENYAKSANKGGASE